MMDLFTTHYISLIGIIAAVAYIVQRKVVRFYLNRSHYTYRSNFNKLSVKPELIVYGVKTNSLVHIIDVLCKKGFIIFPTFKVLNAASSKVSEQKNINDLELEGTYVLTLGLSLKLVKTLTHIYSKVQVHDDHIDSGGSDALRVLLFDKIAAIIRRIPVEYKSIQPIHDDTKLTDLINTIGSSFFVPDPLFPIRDYFGPRLAVLFSWHYYLIGVFAVCSAISLLFIFVPKPEYYPILSILSSLFMSSSFAYYRSRFEKKAAELTPLKYTQEEEEIEYTALAGKEVSQLRLLWVAVSWSIASLVPILQIVLATYIKIAVVIGLTYYEATSLHSVTEFTHFQFTILGSVLYSGICHLMTSTLHTYLVPLLLYIEAPVTSSEKRNAMGSKETIFRVFVFIAWLGPDMFQYLSTFSTSDIITQTSLRSRLEIEFLVLGLVDFSLIHGLHSYIFGRFLDYMYKPHDHTLDVEHLHKQSSVRHLHLNRERSSTFSSKIISPKAPLCSWPVYNTIKNTFQKLRQTDEPKDGITETSVKETEPKDTEIFEFQLPRGLRSLSHASSVYFDRDTLDDGEEKFDDTAPAYKNDIVKSNNNTASGTLPTTNTTTAATTANQNALVDTTATENSAASQMLSRVDMALETDEDGNPIPQPLMTEDAVTEIDNEVPDDTGNNNNDYSLTAPSSDDALLFRECSGPKFDYKTKQFHIYAWVILSGLVSPLSPLVYPTFFIFFWVEFKTNFYELLTCRRTSAEEASIDPWLHQMEILSIFSLVYNIFVFSYMGSFKTWDLSILHFPLRFAGASEYIISALDEPVVRSFVTTVLLEHMSLIFRVLLLPYALKFMSGHTIRSIQALKRVMMLRENLMAKLLIQKDANTASTLAKSYSNLTGHWGAKMRLAEIQSTIGTSMSPMIWVSLSLVPFLAYYYFNVPWWLTFIPLFIALCYQQNKIDRQKRGIAMNIVSDSTVFDFIKKELPGFLFDSDLNRSDWCNDMFTHTWPMLVKFGQNKILSKVKPVLEKSCPSFFHKLEISKLDLGTQPPSILGIRILERRAGADMVEMDMDWKWVSNMKASLSLYLTKDTKVTISVSNFQFSGKARYQLTPLIPKVPPFGTVKGTFFQKPFVDFTLSFGDVDLMNLGYSQGAISTAIHAVLKQAMESVCMYPKWIVIDIVDPESIGRMPAETFFVSPPEGVLNVQIHCCKDLMIGDILTSDPYVKLSVLDEVYQTPTIFKTLNPTWRNAEYSFLIRDKRADCLKLDVFDYDVVSSDKFLGTTQIYLDSLLDGVAQSFTHELRGVAHGTITFSVAYIRLSKPEELDSDQIISSAQDIDFNIDDLMDTFAMATGKDDYLSRSLKTSSDNVEIDVSNIQQFSVTPSVVDGPISPNVDVVSTEGSFSAADNNEKESQSPRSSTNVMGNVLKWARKSGPSSISKLFKKNNLKNDSNKSADSNKTNSLDSKKDPLSAKTTVPMNHIESIPRMSSLTKVSGVITLSDLHVFGLNSSATASMGNYVHFVVYFNLGHYKRKTSEANKQVDVKFKETFNIIVGDIYQDVLTIKIKKINHLGYKQVISQIDVRAKNIMNSPDQTYTVSEDISKDKVIASGQLECKLKYRAAARMPPAIL